MEGTQVNIPGLSALFESGVVNKVTLEGRTDSLRASASLSDVTTSKGDSGMPCCKASATKRHLGITLLDNQLLFYLSYFSVKYAH